MTATASSKPRLSLRFGLKLGKREYWLLASIVFIAAALRFYRLGEWSFWGDEVITVRRASELFDLEIHRWSPSRVMTYFALTWFGVNEWSARLVPALFGILSVPALYFPLRSIFGRSVSLLAILLLALSTWHLYWSQNARFYTAELLFYNLSLLLFFVALERDSFRASLVALLFLGLATLERATALFFLPVTALYIGIIWILPFEKPPGLRLRLLASFFVPALVVGGLIALGYPTVRSASLWQESFGRINTSPLWILSGVVYYIGIPTVLLAMAGSVHMLAARDRATLLLALGAVVPLTAIMGVSLVQYAANRYVFISLLFWILLASQAVVALQRIADSRFTVLVGGVVAILILTPLSENVLYFQYQNGNREDARSAFELIKREANVDDLVVASNPELARFYLDLTVVGMQGLDPSALEERAGDVWFVEDMNTEERFPAVRNWMLANSRPIANFDVNVRARNFKMRVYQYQSEGRARVTSHGETLDPSQPP